MEQLASAGQQIDFSLIALFMRASLIVKIVMVLLILASFWSWALIIQKLLKFAAARADATKFDRAFWSGEPLDDLYDRIGQTPRGAPERIFAAGMGEWRKSQDDQGGMIPGTQQRIDRAMNVAIGREEARLTRGLSWLATIGSTAPFIGLFGTVWGIKTAFEQIAIAQDTSLAVVAQQVHHLHDLAVTDRLIGAQEDPGFPVTAGFSVQLGRQRLMRDRRLPQRQRTIRRDGQPDRLVGPLRGRPARGGQVDIDVHRRQRGGDHEDDQQHQHHVHEGRDVDFRHRLTATAAAPRG